jgi:predicted DNA-binding transcriptional regulator YafY
MAKREFIQRHLLIIRRLKTKPSSFEELKRYLLQQQEITDDNFDISKRTFQRDLKDICSIYGITVSFNKRENWYEITEEDEEKPFERIIEAFETVNALNYSEQVSKNLFLEKRNGKGTEYMHGLLYAIENHFEVKILHHSFEKEIIGTRLLQPIAIKESQNRWYLVCMDAEIKEIRNFALDRILNLELSTTKFKPIEFDTITYYKNAFGVECYEPATKITIIANAYQALYIKSLPLHSSQIIIQEDEDFCTFEYFMHPTKDIMMELMRFGENLEVTKPIALREEIKKRIHQMVKLYDN